MYWGTKIEWVSRAWIFWKKVRDKNIVKLSSYQCVVIRARSSKSYCFSIGFAFVFLSTGWFLTENSVYRYKIYHIKRKKSLIFNIIWYQIISWSVISNYYLYYFLHNSAYLPNEDPRVAPLGFWWNLAYSFFKNKQWL